MQESEASEPMGGVERAQDLKSKVLYVTELVDLGMITLPDFLFVESLCQVSQYLEQGENTVYFVGLRTGSRDETCKKMFQKL